MRIVLVDPSRTAAKFVIRLLEARSYDVRLFADGLEALAYIKSDPEIGVLITTAEPLSISGLELCWETRLVATGYRPIYVIMMSSNSDDDQLTAALDHGADDFLSKPPLPKDLYARLRAAERFGIMQRELIRLATTDSLTGMYNRRAFFEKAAVLSERAAAGEPLCAVMVDIDHFKSINDVHGHEAGDQAICAVAHSLMVERALVGRMGGEEFAVLLDGRSLADAVGIAERRRAKIAGMQIEAGDETVVLTCSFGVSDWQKGDTIDRLLKRADMALYEAKIGGRNCVVAADNSMLAPTYSESGSHIRAPRKTA